MAESTEEDIKAPVDPEVEVTVMKRIGNKPPIEELLYYANIQRETYTEGHDEKGMSQFTKVLNWADEKKKEHSVNVTVTPLELDDTLSEREREKLNAHRALRTAGWAAMFYLITTDILGPFNAPYAFSTVGYVGGVFLYALFGIGAGYTSLLLLYMYLRLDSDRYPVRNYADLVEVVAGPIARRFATAGQSIQLIVIVATVILGNGQALFQITQSQLCFIVSVLIFGLLGMCIGQIQSLKSVAWVGSASVYLNISVILISIGFFANSPPNYVGANAAYGLPIDPPAPIEHVAIVDGTLANKVNGAMNMVYAWGGMMIFPEMMAEMRRPMDFWKSIACAELVIMIVYVMYGIVGYSLQGQYVLPLAYQGVSKYAWQSVGNAITLLTVTIAGTLYSNIGVKVAFMVIVYWAVAFVIASSIPQVQTLQGLIGATFLMQYSYTFPFAFDVIVDATKGDPTYVPGQPHKRSDTWRDISRWKRGLFTGRVWFKWMNFILALAGAATACLGIYGAVITIQVTFANGAATSFGCAAPV
ncbi:hypothetical protein DACRYDRAFT_106844 [Dacryopinax primogenitus]|uniref:Amino acid transporter transmembrane domain-containing protein n=1 Tax=Dacryopinax primogenitus (strain DJM 731) TaxID=1858805 RepID=M5GDX8_DACPD|nr:uncharacterized protein DACRYDRAFT_106844 [Dacryopinax primogenitus]EJU02788.1 hypothetical protein DACRYDRAFT_106844 [Dacryopinax primogenitus]